MNSGPFELHNDLILKLSEDGQHLMAEFLAAQDRQPINLDWFKEKLTEFGLDQLLVNQDSLKQCIKQYNNGNENSSINIAKRLDGEFSISLSDDHKKATLSFKPAQGGLEVTRDMIDKELAEQNICFGLKRDVINEAIKGSSVSKLVIASHLDPVNGEDGYFENLIPDAKDRRPRIDDKGIAHYNDIAQFVTVKPGDTVVKRHLRTDGQDGKTVTGDIIEATSGQDVTFSTKLPGTTPSPDNPNVLIAAIAGQPVVVERGSIVEPTVTVQDVDANTGNIEFDGSVLVKGDVTTGMQIRADGDVTIQGMVEAAAIIETDGDIVVQNGVIGRGSIIDEDGNPGKGIVHLQSKGSIAARFVENTQAVAGNTINVGELVAHSDLTAKNHIIVGAKNSKRGHIMGGICRAEKGLQALVLGSPASVNTKIEVGTNQQIIQNLEKSNQSIEAKQKESEALEQSYKDTYSQQKLKPNSKRAVFLERLRVTRNSLIRNLKTLSEQNSVYQKQVEELAKARVTVTQKIYNSVEVTIYNEHLKTTEEHSPGIFVIEDKKILFKPQ